MGLLDQPQMWVTLPQMQQPSIDLKVPTPHTRQAPYGALGESQRFECTPGLKAAPAPTAALAASIPIPGDAGQAGGFALHSHTAAVGITAWGQSMQGMRSGGQRTSCPTASALSCNGDLKCL